MAIIRKKIKVPYFPKLRHAGVVDIFDTSKYWVTMDVFFDDEWDKSVARPIMFIHSGSGVHDEYPLNNGNVVNSVGNGIIPCVVYYFSPRTVTPSHTPMPPWYAGYGLDKRAFYAYSIRLVYNVHSALVYAIDRFPEETDFKADLDNIFMCGKSQGGATSLLWSFWSRGLDFDWDIYGSKVKAIINNQGLLGTSSGGWREADRTVNIVARGITQGNHRMIHVYNDQDISGDYDFAQRMRSAVPGSALDNHYFLNFSDLGHDQDSVFNQSIVWSIIRGDSPLKGVRSTGVQVTAKSEYQLVEEAVARDSLPAKLPKVADYFSDVTLSSPDVRASLVCVDVSREDAFSIRNAAFHQNGGVPQQVGSCTKLLTLITWWRTGFFNSEEELTRTSDDSALGSGANLNVGETISSESACLNIMLPSSNVTANIVARVCGGKLLVREGARIFKPAEAVARFVEEMNKVAYEIGMYGARFTTPSGLNSNTATPLEMARLMYEGYKNPLVMKGAVKTYDMLVKTPEGGGRVVKLESTHELLGQSISGYTAVIGKTGTLVPLYNVCTAFYNQERKILCLISVLGASSSAQRFGDTIAIMTKAVSKIRDA